MDAAVHDLEPERLVGFLRLEIVGEGVRCHFAAAVGAGPFLCRAQKGRADALAAMLFAYEPSFQKADRLLGIATIGVGTKADLGKPN